MLLECTPRYIGRICEHYKGKASHFIYDVLEENESGQPCYNAYSLNRENGEISYLLGDFSSDLSLQASVDQEAYLDGKGYQYERIAPDELNSLSEKIKEKFGNLSVSFISFPSFPVMSIATGTP